jgi:nucleoside-diphosphate-sugar epimerase
MSTLDLLPRLHQCFTDIDGARILLTGGTGFVGKWMLQTAKIAQENSATKIEIVIPTRRLSSDHVQTAIAIGCPHVSWIEADFINDQPDFGHIDMIIHAATPASAELNESNPIDMTRINTQSMQAALKFAENRVPFLFTSSGAVYGNQPQSVAHISEMQDRPFSELTSAYAKGKQLAESMCLQAAKEGSCTPVIARLFAFSGHYLPRDTHFAIGNFVQNVIDRKPIHINSDGQARRSYLYGADMAIWLWSALAKRSSPHPLHIGSEHSVSILELAQAVARVSTTELNFVPEIKVANPSANSEKFHQYIPSNSATKSYLNVQEWTSLETGIALMIRDHLI